MGMDAFLQRVTSNLNSFKNKFLKFPNFPAGPEQHLYKKMGDSLTVSNIISRSTLENPKFGLLSRNTLRLKVKVRVYPKHEMDEVEVTFIIQNIR